MGGCIPLLPRQSKAASNPIKQFLVKWTIDETKNKWTKEELDQINAMVDSDSSELTYQEFSAAFPALQKLSHETSANFYRIINRSETSQASKQDLIDALTLIHKTANKDLMSKMLFFVYSSDVKKQFLSPNDYVKFVREHEQNFTSKPAERSNKPLNMVQFEQQFIKLNPKRLKELFVIGSDKSEQEFINELLTKRLMPTINETVYVVEFQWFEKWRNYLQKNHAVKIRLQDGISAKKSVQHEIILVPKSEVGPKSTQSLIGRPSAIRNSILEGQFPGQLKDNLVEGVHYILVPEWIWNRLLNIYKGGPVFSRKYPNVYPKIALITAINARGKFLPKLMLEYEPGPNVTVESLFKSTAPLLYFYKNLGKQNWQPIPNPKACACEFMYFHHTYFVAVPITLETTFRSLYNVSVQNGQKALVNNIQNYASSIKVYLDGVLRTGYVSNFSEEEVDVQVREDDGYFVLRKVRIDRIKGLNPTVFDSKHRQNSFAGLYNVGNTCYINGVVQCLLKTSFFADYLILEKLDTNEPLLLRELRSIYKKSQETTDPVEMHRFKSVFEGFFNFFIGHSQHDAQQFLLNLLSRISQQLKESRKAYIEESQAVNRNERTRSVDANARVIKFFSGDSKINLACENCKWIGEKKIETFFTWSVSLPEIEQERYDFYVFSSEDREDRKQRFVRTQRRANVDMGETLYVGRPRQISTNNMMQSVVLPQQLNSRDWSSGVRLMRYSVIATSKLRVGEFKELIAKQLQIPKENLLVVTVLSNEWHQNLDSFDQNKLASFYKLYDLKIMCYKLKAREKTQRRDMLLKERGGNHSVKLEVKTRIFDQKLRLFRAMHVPFLLEVNVESTIDSVTAQLHQLASNVLDLQYLTEARDKAKSQKNLDDFEGATIRTADQIPSVISLRKTNSNAKIPKEPKERPSIIDLNFFDRKYPYDLHIISKLRSDDRCAVCNEHITPDDNKCEGCFFNLQEPTSLFDLDSFRSYYNQAVITIDLLSTLPFIGIGTTNHQSYKKLISSESNTSLVSILQSSLSTSEVVEVGCFKCPKRTVLRIEELNTTPNILILHLKRFRYTNESMVKLGNFISYEQSLEVRSDSKYELYGVVVHEGTSLRGHYFSYVKQGEKWYLCDDDKVTPAKEREWMHRGAYLLFYRKANFEPSLVCLGF